MKKKKSIVWAIITLCILILLFVGYRLYDLMFNGAVKVQKADLIAGFQQCIPQIIVGSVILLISIILFVLSKVNKQRNLKDLLNVQGFVALILSVLVTITSVCLGPMYANLNNVLAGNDEISPEHVKESIETSKAIANEGITLLKNTNDALPLKANTKVNVFGWSSVSSVFGGNGSGGSSTDDVVTLIDGLNKAGFETNTVLSDFYANYRTDRPPLSFWGVDFTIPEPSMAEYNEAGIFENAKEFSDTAIIVIGRSSGEGSDLAMSLSNENNFVIDEQGRPITFSTQEDDLDASKSYLELSNREEAMVEEVTNDFDNVIVVINSSPSMELGWVDQYKNINGVLWCPSPGQVGFEALGQILSGEVNPSGHTVDTFVYDLLDTPYINNFGSFRYTDYVDVTGSEENPVPFVNYNEGIYVGYKFYETAAAEGLIDYDSVVQYPFGYGLSYTDFDASIANVNDDGKTISVDVDVKNVGQVAGKFLAEIYYNPPYTNGGIEKASANLVGFSKTDLINPNESQTVTINFNYEDMASYDSDCIKSSDGAYVLEAGDYQINLCSDSHTILDTYTAKVSDDIIYDDGHDGARSTDDIAATNQFSYAKGDVTYLSRANGFENYEEAVAGPSSFVMTEEIKKDYTSRITYDAAKYDADATMPTTDADNGLKIQDMTGLDYDDPKWELLLDELSVSELKNLVAEGGFHIYAADSINMPESFETDGPTAVNSFFTGKTGTAFPAPIMVASTWNVDLARAFGDCIAQELVDYGFTGWYGNAMNIHRTAFSGRNFEYFSEDGFLSGKIAAAEIKAAREHGIISYIKHFALNDSETDRAKGICTWTTEQAMREIYLKGFEIAIKEGNSLGVMNSKNSIGAKWVGSTPELMNTVLRNEWGFKGVVITDALDAASEYYQNPNEAVRCGTDKMLAMGVPDDYWDDESAGTITALRNASHNILFAVANSNAMDLKTGAPSWMISIIVVDVIIILLLIVWEFFAIRKYKKLAIEVTIE